NWVVQIDGSRAGAAAPVLLATYPEPHSARAYADGVPQGAIFEPVTNLDAATFTLTDASHATVAASVHQVGDGTWGLFPDRVFLKAGQTYTARVAAGVCGYDGACTTKPIVWCFTVAAQPDEA